jgi:succinyl-diaminopimelate desuccinylase
MNKRLQVFANTRAFTQFTTRLADKWNLKILPNPLTEPKGDEKVEDFLRDLVAMPTVTGNYEAIHDAFDYIDRLLRGFGLFVKRYEWNNVESLVASTKRTKAPTVCLLGHIDVVPGAEEVFQLKERDGKYYGRGVVDMKIALAAYLSAVKDLAPDLHTYDFSIMITSDEEVSGFDGAAMLAEEGYRPKVIVLPDGGSNWNMERFSKGIWHITIEAFGTSAHGSRPWEGDNAIDKLTAAITEIRKLFPKVQGAETSTINVGIIQGGKAINQIPANATASIDMRFITRDEQTKIGRAIEAIVDRTEGLSLTTEVKAEAVINDPGNFYLKEYAACTEKVIGRQVEWVASNASNDGRFFASHGIPCAISYPPGGNHHGPAEYTTKEAPAQMQMIITNFLKNIAKIE